MHNAAWASISKKMLAYKSLELQVPTTCIFFTSFSGFILLNSPISNYLTYEGDLGKPENRFFKGIRLK